MVRSTQSSAVVKTKSHNRRALGLFLVPIPAILLVVLLFLVLASQQFGAKAGIAMAADSPGSRTVPLHDSGVVTPPVRPITILLDDFTPQRDGFYLYNRLGGERRALNSSQLKLGAGQLTTTIAGGQVWGGLWTSLNHPIDEGLAIDFSAVMPPQIRPFYQSQIVGVSAKVAAGTPGLTLRLELKDRLGVRQWSTETILTGGQQMVSATLPPLGEIKEFLWVMDQGTTGDYVVLDSVSFSATTQIIDPAIAAYVWSYGMLLNNWDPDSGLVRDKARFASGQFDAIQATGSLAAATAVAAQLGVIDSGDARQIVDTISNTLLIDTPRFHGLWPHFANVSPSGTITIAPGTEWSSIDTVIAAIALLGAQGGLGLDTAGTEEMIRSIDWGDMVRPEGISHGYWYNGDPIPIAWDIFGGESWLVELAHASAGGQPTSLKFPAPPTANGSGFIDELAWLTVLPPRELDYWGNDWQEYRLAAAQAQIDYFHDNYPGSCFDKLGLFGLSAGEVPVPWAVAPGDIYQAFGVGGRFAGPNDGAKLFDAPAITPHYAPMIAALYPNEATAMWTWLIEETPFSPLNNIESLMFPEKSDCGPEEIQWNHLKGSWNLALQTLGWGNYLVQRQGQIPVTWQTTLRYPYLREGYNVLVPNGIKRMELPVIVN